MRHDIIETKEVKLKRLTDALGTAYPERTLRTHAAAQALASYAELEGSEQAITLAGRVRSLRLMGKIAFVHIEDGSGQFQIFLSENHLGGAAFRLFMETVEMGDIIEATGVLFTTKQGEPSLDATRWTMLAKSLRPIPSEHFGLKDEEARLRRRYLDLMVNPKTRELFQKKNLFWQTVRAYLAENGFLEVQTPVLEHVPGGAEAEPFVTHHKALGTDFYLRISLELPLKRLLVGGYERVFEIGRVFRNEGIDREHLQEFDHMEWYGAYLTMEDGLRMTEELYRRLVEVVAGGRLVTVYEGEEIDWGRPFPVVDYFEAFQQATDIDLSGDVTVERLHEELNKRGIVFEPTAGKGRLIDILYKKTVRQNLIQPCFLVGHPLEVSPLAKANPNNSKKALRFQPVAVRSELGNGFAELNDPLDQRRRFEAQMALRAAGDREGMMLDEDYLEALEYGMPPACGFGMSERLFAILMNRSVRETVIFPPMRGK